MGEGLLSDPPVYSKVPLSSVPEPFELTSSEPDPWLLLGSGIGIACSYTVGAGGGEEMGSRFQTHPHLYSQKCPKPLGCCKIYPSDVLVKFNWPAREKSPDVVLAARSHGVNPPAIAELRCLSS